MSDNDLTATSSGPAIGGHRPMWAPPRWRPMARKSHTKSRTGCPNCKRRRVKCDEATPECGPCRRLGHDCEYLRRDSWSSGVAPPSVTTPPLARCLPSRPGTLDMADLRFFHHFIVSAYPPFPIGGWSVWQTVSQMSHDYDFLVHAILGLGASHLSLLSPTRYTQEALRHRVIAIKCLNGFLSRAHDSIANTDAAFAAILALTYQAVYMHDGLMDFLTMTRGCFLVGSLLAPNFQSSTFKTFERDSHVKKAVQLINCDEPHRFLDCNVAAGFRASLERLSLLCHSVVEVEYLAMMRKIASDLAKGYRHHSFLFEKLGQLSPEQYASFIDPQNKLSWLVIIHMLVLDCFMSGEVYVEDIQHPGIQVKCANHSTLNWVERIDHERHVNSTHVKLDYIMRQFILMFS